MSLAGLAALGLDCSQRTTTKDPQSAAEAEGEAVTGARGGVVLLAVLRVTLLGILRPRLVVTQIIIFLGRPRSFVHTLHLATLDSPSAGSCALAPGPYSPCSAWMFITKTAAGGFQTFIAATGLRAGDQPLLHATAALLRALSPGGNIPLHTFLLMADHLYTWLVDRTLAVEGSQDPLVPSVHTLDVSEPDSIPTAPGALAPVPHCP